MHERYIIPEPDRIEESLRLSHEFGVHFEYNDFFAPNFLDDQERVRQRIQFYRELERDRSRDLLHGAFLDVTIHSEDDQIRRISQRRVYQSMDVAAALGVRGVVFHTNFIPNFRLKSYIDHWISANARFWRQVCRDYPKMEILIENMFDEEPTLLRNLAEEMDECRNFGICLDYAHGASFGAKTNLDDWVTDLLPYVRHIHINDNDLVNDLHQPVGQGKIDWQNFSRRMVGCPPNCSVLIEVRRAEQARTSLIFMKENGIFPFSTAMEE